MCALIDRTNEHELNLDKRIYYAKKITKIIWSHPVIHSLTILNV